MRTSPFGPRRTAVALAVVLALSVVLAACGGSDDEGVVQVTLTDSPTSQSVEADTTTFTAGEPYHFVVQNDGDLAHELMIVEPIEPGTMDMEEMDSMALYVIEEDELEPGSTYEFDFVFPSDTVGEDLELACHISGHYEAGMHTSITVES